MSNRENNPFVFLQHSAFVTLVNEIIHCSAISIPSKRIVLWDHVKQISSIHHGYLHYPFHKESLSVALKAVSLSVFLALGTPLYAQAVTAAEEGS